MDLTLIVLVAVHVFVFSHFLLIGELFHDFNHFAESLVFLFQIRHVLLDLFLNVLLGFKLCLKLEFGCAIVVYQYFLIELMNVMSRQFFKT